METFQDTDNKRVPIPKEKCFKSFFLKKQTNAKLVYASHLSNQQTVKRVLQGQIKVR